MPKGYEVERIAVKDEGRLRAAVPRGARLVVLDEHGRDLSTAQFAKLLQAPAAFVIGGAEGLAAATKNQADTLLRLSAMTLPHALAQVVLIEQLYRAATFLTGHPYHREENRVMAGPVERGIYLASRSPRRRELLVQIGVRFHLLLFRARPGEGPDVDEISMPGELPDLYVERMARAKAEAGWRRMLQRNLPIAPVLAADTTVALDGRIFEKPVDRSQAAEMIQQLSGRNHEVLTAVALKQDDWMESALSRSEVRFKTLSAREIEQYVATGEGDDKAGAYAIQGRAARFVIELRGSYSGVMGLPLYETAELIEKLAQRR
jgi:septum formation protein